MTRADFATFSASLQTYYPRHDMLPNKAAMDLWYVALKDLDYEVLSAALAKWIVTERFPPTIAELREKCSEVTEGKLPDWGEGWMEVSRAVRRYGFMRPDEAMESMSETTREAVRRIGWTEICTSENTDTLRAQFRQVYEIVSKRAVEDRKIPEALKTTIEQIQLGGAGQRQIGGGT